MAVEEPYSRNEDGVFIPVLPVQHRDDEYDSSGFHVLQDMQSRHFWYLGRHRFILQALNRSLIQNRSGGPRPDLKGVDLGGGCGGWIRYLQDHNPTLFRELALADSSMRALESAATVVGSEVKRYQVDCLQLHWTERWDVAFLLDVLEHIPQDLEVLRQIRQALLPGGLLIVTTPALNAFWTYNDELAQHVRRYTRLDFHRLAKESGFEVCLTRYFMFFLSPLLWLSRRKSPNVKEMTRQERRQHVFQSHSVPSWPINQILRMTFSLETPLGLSIPFPWGTSVMAVLRKRM